MCIVDTSHDLSKEKVLKRKEKKRKKKKKKKRKVEIHEKEIERENEKEKKKKRGCRRIKEKSFKENLRPYLLRNPKSSFSIFLPNPFP